MYAYGVSPRKPAPSPPIAMATIDLGDEKPSEASKVPATSDLESHDSGPDAEVTGRVSEPESPSTAALATNASTSPSTTSPKPGESGAQRFTTTPTSESMRGEAATMQSTVQPDIHFPPEVESLKAMFPDLDAAIIQSVLESVNGDQERAADVLLGMSDPNYVSHQHNTPHSQTDLDEQLARRLLLEEQQQAVWTPEQNYGQWQGQGQNVPYQPRSRGHHHAPQDQGQLRNPQQGGGGRDTMSEMQEQFSKIAESGKKTFSSFVGKMKAKMQEFDTSKAHTPGSSSQNAAGFTPPAGPPPTSQVQQSQAPTDSQYYMAASEREDYTRAQGTQGYDATPQPHSGGVPEDYSRNISAKTGTSSPPSPPTSSRPTSTGPSPSTVDPNKIGLLPKRPVSLLGPSPVHKEDDDELEYVENPFEDERH